MSLVGLKYGWSLGGSMASKKESGANIQQGRWIDSLLR